MEYEIVEPINRGSWQDESRQKLTAPDCSAAAYQICLKAMDIPESEET